MARSRTGQILPEGSRVYVEEQLFRAASAFAFDWGLQPRPALKGIHHPAVAAMNAALPRLRQRLCSGREETSRLKETQVRHRFVVPTLVSPRPGGTKEGGSPSFGQRRKKGADRQS